MGGNSQISRILTPQIVIVSEWIHESDVYVRCGLENILVASPVLLGFPIVDRR